MAKQISKRAPTATPPHEQVTRLLNNALARLKQQKASLSIRALALHLELSPSFLSKVFRGERSLPKRLLGPLAKILQIDHHEVAELQRLLLAKESEDLSRSTGIALTSPGASPGTSTDVLKTFRALGHDEYWLIEEWFRLPLLNLFSTHDFRADARFIADRLGLQLRIVEKTLSSLIERGYLVETPEGFQRTELRIRFPTQRSHSSIRAYHRSVIERSLKALDSDKDFDERLVSGISFAGDPKRIPEAKIIIEEALYRAAEVLASGEVREVFQLNLQLFKVSKRK